MSYTWAAVHCNAMAACCVASVELKVSHNETTAFFWMLKMPTKHVEENTHNICLQFSLSTFFSDVRKEYTAKMKTFFLFFVDGFERDYNGVVRRCCRVLFLPVCPPPWDTALSHCTAHSTASLISLISLAVFSLRSLSHLCESVYVLRVMATNDKAESASRRQDNNCLFPVLLSGCFSVTRSSKSERWDCFLEWWNEDVGWKDGKGKCQE